MHISPPEPGTLLKLIDLQFDGENVSMDGDVAPKLTYLEGEVMIEVSPGSGINHLVNEFRATVVHDGKGLVLTSKEVKTRGMWHRTSSLHVIVFRQVYAEHSAFVIAPESDAKEDLPKAAPIEEVWVTRKGKSARSRQLQSATEDTVTFIEDGESHTIKTGSWDNWVKRNDAVVQDHLELDKTSGGHEGA